MTDKPTSGVESEPVLLVMWYEHDCPWITKFCDEEHLRRAMVPRDVLAQYVTAPARERKESRKGSYKVVSESE